MLKTVIEEFLNLFQKNFNFDRENYSTLFHYQIIFFYKLHPSLRMSIRLEDYIVSPGA